MLSLWRMISILFPLYCLIVSKKTDYFLRDFVRRERGFWWLNVNPSSFVHWYGCCCTNECSRLWFCFCLWSGCNNLDTCLWYLLFLWICKNFCVVLNWIDHIFDRSIGYSDPRLRIILIYRPNSNFNPMFAVLKTGCDFQYKSNSHVSLNPSFCFISPRTIDWPIKTSGSPDPSWWVSNSSQKSRHCSVDTELIDRKDNAKNCVNCEIICSEVYRQFSMSFALELTPGQWSRCTENRMSAFCEFQEHFFRDMIPGSLWTVLGRIPFLLRTWTNKWPLSNTKTSRKYFHDSGICQAFIFVAFSVTRDVIEHWHK